MLEQLEQQKRLTANQWKLIATTNLADLLDFFDLFLIGYVLAFITKEWQLTYWQGAMILLSSGLGAVPGAFLWGWVADWKYRARTFLFKSLGLLYHWPVHKHVLEERQKWKEIARGAWRKDFGCEWRDYALVTRQHH
jgi:hypothetical protein